jgi:hypothetical protein
VQIFNYYSLPLNLTCRFSLGNVGCKRAAASFLRAFHPCRAPIEKGIKLKSKEIPLKARTGPEGSRSLRLPDFKTIGT